MWISDTGSFNLVVERDEVWTSWSLSTMKHLKCKNYLILKGVLISKQNTAYDMGISNTQYLESPYK